MLRVQLPGELDGLLGIRSLERRSNDWGGKPLCEVARDSQAELVDSTPQVEVFSHEAQGTIETDYQGACPVSPQKRLCGTPGAQLVAHSPVSFESKPLIYKDYL